jgi:hypothetical protein
MKGPRDPEAAGLPAADAAVLRRFLDEEGRLRQWPARRRIQLFALRWLIAHFERDHRYTQAEVDAMLQDLHGFADWVFLRRELVDARLLDRTTDGREYWRPAATAGTPPA